MITDEELKSIRNPPRSRMEDPATDRQKGYIAILVEDRDVPESWLLKAKGMLEAGLTKGDASRIIGAFKAMPLKQGARDRSKSNPDLADVPAGYYAVRMNTSRLQTKSEKNDIAFFRVWRGTKNTGVFKVYKQLGPNFTELDYQRSLAVLKWIYRSGSGEASVLYGQKIGRCGKCGRELTNRVSRETGLGPICGGRLFSDWQERVSAARQAIERRGEDPDAEVQD